ncbi:hypothetical protein SUDANB121_02860 [Nocardiopsis dassonvillei]|uniref:hypothetical protein n=1 Tax=Nocardiopsis dassonvillei TaxID=2014 RepID=UPI003F552C27
MAEWRAYVDNPVRALRKITHDTLPKRGKVVAASGPREGEQVWWVDGVAYTDVPETVWALVRKRARVEGAPECIPADYTARVEAEQRRRAEAAARREPRKHKEAAGNDADGRTST